MVVVVTAYQWMDRLMVNCRVSDASNSGVLAATTREGVVELGSAGELEEMDILALVAECVLDIAYDRTCPF